MTALQFDLYWLLTIPGGGFLPLLLGCAAAAWLADRIDPPQHRKGER